MIRKKEIVVSAPFHGIEKDGILYHKAGALYIYDPETFERVGTIQADLGTSVPARGYGINYNYCPRSDSVTGECLEYGYQGWPYPGLTLWADSSQNVNPNARHFAYDMACAEYNSNMMNNTDSKSALLVSEPSYHDGSIDRGRVLQYEMLASGLSPTREIHGPNDDRATLFGASLEYLSSFQIQHHLS